MLGVKILLPLLAITQTINAIASISYYGRSRETDGGNPAPKVSPVPISLMAEVAAKVIKEIEPRLTEPNKYIIATQEPGVSDTGKETIIGSLVTAPPSPQATLPPVTFPPATVAPNLAPITTFLLTKPTLPPATLLAVTLPPTAATPTTAPVQSISNTPQQINSNLISRNKPEYPMKIYSTPFPSEFLYPSQTTPAPGTVPPVHTFATLPPWTLPPATLPPATTAAPTLPPVTAPPATVQTLPPWTLPPVTLPPATTAAPTLPPVTAPPATVQTLPPWTLPPVTLPPATTAAPTLPPVTAPPATVQTLPPWTLPPVTLPPATTAAPTLPPVTAPPATVQTLPPWTLPPVTLPPATTAAPTLPLNTAPPATRSTLPPRTWPPATTSALSFAPVTATPAYVSTEEPYTAIRLPETPKPSIIQGYRCQQAYGYFSVANKCDSYVECKNNVAYSNVCPDGLHFNPKSKHPEFPCAYPVDVQCTADQIAPQTINSIAPIGYYGTSRIRDQSFKQSRDSTNSPTILQDIETAGPAPKVSPVPISLMAEVAAKVIKDIKPRLPEPNKYIIATQEPGVSDTGKETIIGSFVTTPPSPQTTLPPTAATPTTAPVQPISNTPHQINSNLISSNKPEYPMKIYSTPFPSEFLYPSQTTLAPGTVPPVHTFATLPPWTLPPATIPPATTAAPTLPPVTAPPATVQTLPPWTLPPVTLPPATTAAPTLPPVTAPPATVQTLPPWTLPPVTLPPATTAAPTWPLNTAPPATRSTLPPRTWPPATTSALSFAPVTATPAYISTEEPYTAIRLPETPEPGIIQGYRCQQAYGYFSVANKCDSYVECKNNVAYSNVCPDGLHFNPKSKHPEFPCAYPVDVQCTADQIAQTPIPKGQCLNLYGYFPMTNGDCSKYIVCQNGIANIMKCPAGLVFNTKIDDCDWPINVPSCNLDIFKGFTCPAQPDSDLIENFRFRGSCTSYVACQGGYPRLLNCNLGLRFDEATQSCVDASKVTNCTA